jgi:hypothetical protein
MAAPVYFQLFAVCKRTNQILSKIGTRDTRQRCSNLKAAQSDYQPRVWFTVQAATAYNVGDKMRAN